MLRHTLNAKHSIQADLRLFRTTAYFTAYLDMFQAYSAIFRTLDILRHIYPHSVLLLNHCLDDLFATFFRFCFKSKHLTSFSSGQYFNGNNNNNNSGSLTLARRPHHPRYTCQHATYVTLYPCKHVTHASTPPTLARIALHFSNSH